MRGGDLEDVGASVGDPVHPGLHHVPHILADLGGGPQALGEEEWGHDVLLAGYDPKDHNGGGKLPVLHDRDVIDVFVDPSVVLSAAYMVLVEIIFIGEESEHSGGPVLWLVG